MSEKKRLPLEQHALDLCGFLNSYQQQHGRPYRGNQIDVAVENDWEVGFFTQVLYAARRPEFIQKHHYVIPFVPRGPGPKDWRCIDKLSDDEGLLATVHGEHIRTRDAITAAERILGMKDFRSPSWDHHTPAGRREYEAYVQLEAALVSLRNAVNGG